MSYRLPFLLGLAHGVSDAAAGLLVGVIIQHGTPDMNLQILEYNLLAFGLMPLAGLLFDRLKRPQQGVSASLLVTLAGLMLLPFRLEISILLIGLGSAGLHAGGGSIAITATPGRASAAGVFAGFGVVGLALGGAASGIDQTSARLVLICLLALLSAAIKFTPQVASQRRVQAELPVALPMFMIVVLVVAISLRSMVWVGAQSGLARYSAAAIWVAVAAGIGKLAGGFVSDRFGWKRYTLTALTGAGLLFLFASQWLPALMLGALLLQSMTPISIAALGRVLPESPALAASLALGTAVIAGGLPFFLLAGGWFGPAVLAIALVLSALGYWLALQKIQPAERLNEPPG